MKISTFMYSLIFLCAGMCCPEEDDYDMEQYSFETAGLIRVENKSSVYAKGDTLWIRTEIPVNLSTQDGEEVDLSQLSGNSDRAFIYLNLYWKSGFDNPVPVTLSEDEVVPKEGEVEINYGITATVLLKEDSFQSEFGIVLKEAGQFFLSSGYDKPANQVSIYVDSQKNNSIHIFTTFASDETMSDPGFYPFVVE